MRTRSVTLRRAGWGIADQALSSLTNFALGVLVVRTVDLAAFGAFSLAFAAYLTIASVTRAYPMDPLAIRYAAAPSAAFRRAASAATGSVVAIGIACGAVFLLVGLVTSGSFSESLLALGIMLPGLLLQDAWRSAFFAEGRGRLAFLNDVTWVAIQFPVLAAFIATGGRSVFVMVLIWGGSATVAAVVGILQASIMPRPWLAAAWWREHSDLGSRFIAEVLARLVSGQLQLYGVGVVAGLAAVGTLRAGQLLFGPVQVVFFGIGMMALPEGARALAASLRALRRTTLLISGTLGMVATLWGVLVLLIPARLGSLLLGDAWEPAFSLAVPIMLATTASSLSYGAGVGLRALAAAGRGLRATVVVSALALVLGIGGAALDGASGSAWGLCLAAAIGVPIYWYQYSRAVRDYAAAESRFTDADQLTT